MTAFRGDQMREHNYVALAFGGAALIAAAAGRAEAQVTPDSLIAEPPARVTRLQASMRVDHDTNLAKTSDALAEAQGITKADTIYTPNVSVDAVLPVGRQVIYVQGSAGYLFHQKNKDLDSARYNLAAGAGGRLGPCASVLGGKYQRSRGELDDQFVVENVANILEVTGASLAVTCVRSSGLGVSAMVSRDKGENSSERVEASDYRTTAASGSVSYSRPALGTLALQGSYAKTEYPNRIGETAGPGGFETVSFGLRGDRNLGGRIQAGASVSLTDVKLLDPNGAFSGQQTGGGFSGLTYSADVSFRASSRLQLQAAAARQTSPSLLRGQGYEIQEDYSVGLDYRIGSRISVGLGADEQRTDARGRSIDVPVATTFSEARTRVVYAHLRYRQSRRLSFTLNGQVERRRTDNSQFDYNSERIGLSADLAL